MMTYEAETIRAVTALTALDVASSVVDIRVASDIVLYVTYVKGDETNCVLTFRTSPDGVLQGQEAFRVESAGVSTDSLGTHVIAASGTYTYRFTDVIGADFSVLAKATGGTPTGTLKLVAQKGN